MAIACAFVLVTGAAGAADGNAGPSGVRFSNLPGPNLAPYNGSAEGEFAVTPTFGRWFQGMIYGSPLPSIFDGPTNAPGIAVIQITDGLGPFTLSALDYSSNNGDSSYDIQGFRGSILAYHETGILSGSFEPFTFRTLTTGNPSTAIDGLLIEIIPGPGVTSINLDNIIVATVPEPQSVLLLGAALAGLGIVRKTKRLGLS